RDPSHHALPEAGRVSDPAVADIDAHVTDFGRLGTRPSGAEEHDVARAEGFSAHALGRGDLAAHLVRRPSDEDTREPRRSGERLRLVDAPHEPGAVEA